MFPDTIVMIIILITECLLEKWPAQSVCMYIFYQELKGWNNSVQEALSRTWQSATNYLPICFISIKKL